MYMVAVKRGFKARHFLIGGDWGPENELHEHHYQVELQLEGEVLDKHGYLVDIVDIECHLEGLVENYRGKILNDFPDFEGLNPSIENFSRIMCLDLSAKIAAENISALTVRIWENEIAWSSFRHSR